MLLVRCCSNNNRLQVGEDGGDGFPFWSQVSLSEVTMYITFLRLSNKKSVIVSTDNPDHALVKQEEIIAVSILTIFPLSLGS